MNDQERVEVESMVLRLFKEDAGKHREFIDGTVKNVLTVTGIGVAILLSLATWMMGSKLDDAAANITRAYLSDKSIETAVSSQIDTKIQSAIADVDQQVKDAANKAKMASVSGLGEAIKKEIDVNIQKTLQAEVSRKLEEIKSLSSAQLIQRGLKGEKGDKGDKGDKGADGSRGAQGEKGDTGTRGSINSEIVTTTYDVLSKQKERHSSECNNRKSIGNPGCYIAVNAYCKFKAGYNYGIVLHPGYVDEKIEEKLTILCL